jgi:hypothetical protein
MKQLIGKDIGSYIFNPAAKTITLIGISPITLEQILTITNTTDGIMIYCFANASLGGTVSNNILTLTYDTTSMSANDALQIYVDLPISVAQKTAEMTDNYTHLLLERMCTLLAPLATQDGAQRQRISVDSFSATISTVSTLNTITNAVPLGNLATMGGVDPRFLFIENARNSYSNGIRRNLNFS